MRLQCIILNKRKNNTPRFKIENYGYKRNWSLLYNGKGFDKNGNILYELINGNGKVYEYYISQYYDIDKIQYIGEYKNEKKHGKGKEYNKKGNLIFEGEYLNGFKWTGKIYDANNTNIYELKNGSGFIKKYDYDAYLKFEGEYKNGIKNGKGKAYNWGNGGIEKLIFEGEYLDGKKQI